MEIFENPVMLGLFNFPLPQEEARNGMPDVACFSEFSLTMRG